MSFTKIGSAFSSGRFFIANRRLIASSFRASQTRPYTVSVGTAAVPPARIAASTRSTTGAVWPSVMERICIIRVLYHEVDQRVRDENDFLRLAGEVRRHGFNAARRVQRLGFIGHIRRKGREQL